MMRISRVRRGTLGLAASMAMRLITIEGVVVV